MGAIVIMDIVVIPMVDIVVGMANDGNTIRIAYQKNDKSWTYCKDDLTHVHKPP